MATSSDIPVFLTADAEGRIQALSMQRELEAILKHTRQAVPGLRAIEVNPWYDHPTEPHLLLTAYKVVPDSDNQESIRQRWYGWLRRTFRADVAEWFLQDFDYRIDSVPWL